MSKKEKDGVQVVYRVPTERELLNIVESAVPGSLGLITIHSALGDKHVIMRIDGLTISFEVKEHD